MGYKLLGMVVWHGAKWYVHRRYPNAARNAAIGGGVAAASVAVAVGAAIALRQRSGDDD